MDVSDCSIEVFYYNMTLAEKCALGREDHYGPQSYHHFIWKNKCLVLNRGTG